MGKTLIKVDCVDQRLIVTSAPTVASGGKNEDEIEFNFCSKWDGFEKVGVFYRDIKDPHKATIDPTGRCVIPWEVLTSDGYIFIGAFGVKDDITRTTEILKYKVKLGAITEDLKPSDPTPELWEQILARVADKVNVKQGAEHAGKVLGIDEEGNVAPVDGGSGAILDPTLSEANQAAEAKAVGEALANKANVEDLNAFEKNRPFNLTGNPVQVESFEGMPLNPVTVLEPQQQGSGDPYPAGGGRNLLNPAPELTQYNVDDTRFLFRVNGLSDGTYYLRCSNAGAFAHDYRSFILFNESLDTQLFTVSYVLDDVIQITNAKDARYAMILVNVPNADIGTAQLELGSVATEYAPYSNIRPIIGYDKLGLTRCGKNLANAYLYSDDFVRAQIYLEKGMTYTMSVQRAPTALYISDANAQVDYAAAYGVTSLTYTAQQSGVHAFMAYYNDHSAALDDRMQVEIGLDATPFEPYQGKLHTVQIGQTVYGGKFDWLTGKGWIEWEYLAFDGTEAWIMEDGSPWAGENGNAFYMVLPVAGDGNTAPVSNMYKGIKRLEEWTFAPNTVCLSGGGVEVCFVQTEFTTLDEWKSYLAAQKAAGTPVQLVYKLANPIEIQLDAHEILALQGVNTLYGDGEINITGRSDMQAVVSNLLKRIAVLESKANETE